MEPVASVVGLGLKLDHVVPGGDLGLAHILEPFWDLEHFHDSGFVCSLVGLGNVYFLVVVGSVGFVHVCALGIECCDDFLVHDVEESFVLDLAAHILNLGRGLVLDVVHDSVLDVVRDSVHDFVHDLVLDVDLDRCYILGLG